MAITTRLALMALALIAVLGVAAWSYKLAQAPATSMDNSPQVVLTIGTTTVVAQQARTSEERARGLGGRASLEEGSGMWFVFDSEGLWGFWMKDTLIPLDILWVSQDGTIVTIAHSVLPESYPQVYKPNAPARYVLEVPGGFAKSRGIAEGQKVVVQ